MRNWYGIRPTQRVRLRDALRSDTIPSVHESAARWLSLDEVWDRFEEACLAGSKPKIEDFLANIPTEHRFETVRELLKVDAYYWRKVADEPSVAEYRGRFSELDSAWLWTIVVTVVAIGKSVAEFDHCERVVGD